MDEFIYILEGSGTFILDDGRYPIERGGRFIPRGSWEAADELVDAERHDLLAIHAVAAVILVAEGDAGLVEGEQPPVRDSDAVCIP